jgi:CRP/FNR family transcriptional regulator, anaerobic regulatory protein
MPVFARVPAERPRPSARTQPAPAAPAVPTTATVTRIGTLCAACHLSDLCAPCNQTMTARDGRESVSFGRHKLRAHETLYVEGDTFTCVHVVRSGMLMSTMSHPDGRRQVCGFHLPGDVIGLDGLVDGRHATTATALESARSCALDYAQIVEQIPGDAALQHSIGRLMSTEINRTQRLMMLLGVSTAQERLAAFLLDLSQRYKALGYSPREFELRMSRADIGSYLGLTIETVSRTFSTLRTQGLLDVELRHVRILDLDRFAGRFGALLRV